jgi:HK97 family phage major capsid protein
MKTLSPAAAIEVRRIKTEIDTLLAQPNLSRADSKRVDAMLGQISAIKEAGINNDDFTRAQVAAIGAEISAEEYRARAAHNKAFRLFMSGAPNDSVDAELRGTDFLAGTQAITYSDGSKGGVLVPQQFQKAVVEGLAQVDPLLSPEVSTVIQEPGFALPPRSIPGWDLSAIAAVKVDEAAQHNSDTVPGTTQKLLNKFTYRLSLGASLEWEEDQAVFDSALAAMGRAYGIGFARGIGTDLVNGDGSTGPQGVLTGAHDSGITTANSGKLVLTDFTDIYFAVNRIYRNAPKAAWLMDDAVYQLVRQATDNSGRPLLNIANDEETILGKPVYITPSLANSPSVGGGKIIFGDLSHYYVHVSTMWLKRRTQTPGYIEYGKALFTGLMSADAVVHDPTNGSLPPIVFANLHS